MWWFNSNDAAKASNVPAHNATPTTETVTNATPRFDSWSHAFHTCIELRQLRSFSRVLGRELSAQQYDTLINSYEYLGSRALFFGVTFAYPVILGLRWRRRRMQQKLGQELQYWKGAAKALSTSASDAPVVRGGGRPASASMSAAAPLATFSEKVARSPIQDVGQALSIEDRIEPRQPSPTSPTTESTFEKGKPLTLHVQHEVQDPPSLSSHAQKQYQVEDPPRQVYRATAGGWVKTAAGSVSGEARRAPQPNAQEKWARAFGKGAQASSTTDLPSENQAWEALAAERVNARQWDGGEQKLTPLSQNQEDIATTQLFKSAPRSIAKAAKIKALLRKDEDLRRERDDYAWRNSDAERSERSFNHSDPATVYPVAEDSQVTSSGSSPLLDACLEYARREGRKIRLTREKAEHLRSCGRDTVTSKREVDPKRVSQPTNSIVGHKNDAELENTRNEAQDQPSAAIRFQAEGTERGGSLSPCATAEVLLQNEVSTEEASLADSHTAEVLGNFAAPADRETVEQVIDKDPNAAPLEDWTQQAQRYADVEDAPADKLQTPMFDSKPNFQLLDPVDVPDGRATRGRKHGRRQHRPCQLQKPGASADRIASKSAFVYADPGLNAFDNDSMSLRDAIGRMSLFADHFRDRVSGTIALLFQQRTSVAEHLYLHPHQPHGPYRSPEKDPSSLGWKRWLTPECRDHHQSRHDVAESILDELRRRRHGLWSFWSSMGVRNRWRHRE